MNKPKSTEQTYVYDDGSYRVPLRSADELKEKNPYYKDRIKEWLFWEVAYEGGRRFIEEVIKKNARESEQNWLARQEEASAFNYASSIINIFSFYLSEKPRVANMGALEKEPAWKAFETDADHYENDFDQFLIDAQKVSATFGSTGILVDKPSQAFDTRDEEIKNKVYPYCVMFTLPNVYDWKYRRNYLTGESELVYLKLRETEGTILIWEMDHWERWSIERDDKTRNEFSELINCGPNPLGEIPFVWLLNIRSTTNPYFGVSDIKEIAPLVASIIRNISCGEEVIKYSAFPMMRKPYATENRPSNDVVGVTGVLEFDPDDGEGGKPDWLEAACLEPIEAVLKWIDRKVDEIHQAAHLSGVHAQERSSEARSGISMRYEFQKLTAVLSQKSENMLRAEKKILRYWLKWQNQLELESQIRIERSKQFSVDDLKQDLENLLNAKAKTVSTTLRREIEKKVARSVIPEMRSETRQQIEHEIETASPEELFNASLDQRAGALPGSPAENPDTAQ